jgi:hypothetical protein
LCGFHITHVCYMSCPSHLPWFDHPNNIWWSIQVMKFLIMQSSPASCHSSILGLNIHYTIMSKYSLYHNIKN